MKKFTNKKGFTIMEMLIVVAIIAVLVAIAIPTFSSSLEKAKEAADVANIRAAYAEIQVAVLTDSGAAPTADVDTGALNAKIGGSTTTEWDTYFSSKLNYDTKFEYTAPTTAAAGSMVYHATKLGDSSGSKDYTWEIEQLES